MRQRTRLASLVAGAVTVAALLAGCVGIPMSGTVTQGDEISEEGPVDVGFRPSGPREGATQQELLVDFIQAATNPQSDYQTARSFLAQSIRSKWNPDAGVSIRRSGGTPTVVSDDMLDYTITTSARIDADGRYTEDTDLGSQTLEFGFVKEDGQWRLNRLADGIVLSEDNFDAVFTSHALYFFDPSYTFLVPDVRWFANSQRLPTRIASALVKGQAGWLSQGVLVSEFPTGTALGDVVTVISGTATVDLSEEVREASNAQRERMRQQLSASFSNVRTVSSVVLTIGGVPLPINETGAAQAIKQPLVDANPLVLSEDGFGFVSNRRVTPLEPISDGITAIDAGAASLGVGKSIAVARAADGVYVISASGADPLRIDDRAGLINPSIDTTSFVWSARRASTASITAFRPTGEAFPVDTSTLPADASIVSMDVSRDGTRILLYLNTDSGPVLGVAGIIRQDNSVPDRLGEFVQLPIDRLAPIDATWASPQSIATLSLNGSNAVVTTHEIGGPSEVIGRVSGGQSIVGGNGGTDGLWVLTSEGELYKPRGNSWQDTGVDASFLATQQ